MSNTLTATELSDLIQRVFQPGPSDRALVIIVDLPDEELEDNPDWKIRRDIAAGWARELKKIENSLGLKVSLCLYRNARANNADLPEGGWVYEPENLPDNCRALENTATTPFSEIFQQHSIVIAPTELSATAPLKVMSRSLGFRGATMPGFSPEMIPALRLDYSEVNRRVLMLKELLDHSVGADFHFIVDQTTEYDLHLDLRHRLAHASGGLPVTSLRAKPISFLTRARSRMMQPFQQACFPSNTQTESSSIESRTIVRSKLSAKALPLCGKPIISDESRPTGLARNSALECSQTLASHRLGRSCSTKNSGCISPLAAASISEARSVPTVSLTPRPSYTRTMSTSKRSNRGSTLHRSISPWKTAAVSH